MLLGIGIEVLQRRIAYSTPCARVRRGTIELYMRIDESGTSQFRSGNSRYYYYLGSGGYEYEHV